MAVDVDANTFDHEVIKSTVPVLVDFWGPSCGPCLALAPLVEKMEEAFEGKFKLVKIDASKNRRFCLNTKVLSLPTFLIYKDGEEQDRLSGDNLQVAQIEEAINKVV